MGHKKTIIAAIALLCVFIMSCTPSVIKMDESFEELRQAVEKDPNNEGTHYNLGLGYLTQNKFKEAISSFKDALKLNEHFSDAYFAIYCCEIASNQELRRQMLSDNPSAEYSAKIDSLVFYFDMAVMSHPFFEWKLAYMLLPPKKYAYSVYNQALLDSLYSIFYDGYERFYSGDYNKAIEYFNHALTVIPNYHQAKYFRGLTYAITKNYDSAIADFRDVADSINTSNKEKLLPIYLNPAKVYFVIAYTYSSMGNLTEAEKFFKKTLEEDYSFYMAHYHLSNIYSKRHEYDEALNELDAALLVAPNSQIMHYNKGCYLFDLNKYNEALEEFEKTIMLNPKYYRARYNAALIYEAMNDNDKAIKNYQIFAENAPLSKSAAVIEAKRKISILRANK